MAFAYIDDQLHLVQGQHNISLQEVATSTAEPFYIYDLDAMLERLRLFKSAFSTPAAVHYAVKANANSHILKAFAAEGVGVDVVSGGEIDAAIASGFSPDKMVFSGVGKTRGEIEKAVALGIKQINVESPEELRRIAEVAKSMNLKANVAWRMNPDVDPVTHPYIKTGFRENKFGMDQSFVPELKAIMHEQHEFLDLIGLTLHIGSQIRDLSPIYEAVDKTLPLFDQLKSEGFAMQTFDVGGGLGMSYEQEVNEQEPTTIVEYGKRLTQLMDGRDVQIVCEPGRIITARFGLLLGELQYIKRSPHKNFAILDTGMHHLMRPALYQAFHRILPVKINVDGATEVFDVVGPICESADVLGHDRVFQGLQSGQWLAVADAGAYGFVMASHYNSHAMPQELVYSDGKLVS